MYIECPKCGPLRSKGGTRTLSVREFEGSLIVRCFHQDSCEWNNASILTEEQALELGVSDLEATDLNDRKLGLPILDTDIPKNDTSNIYYRYKNREGDINLVIHRLNTPKGKKVFPMYKPDSVLEYGVCDGKFLYNSDLIIKYPECPILVVEGEKTADSAQKAMIQARRRVIVTTWPLGTSNVLKGDWSLLKGREITLWPDNDDTGVKAMMQIREILNHVNSIS